ncbi:MAG: histidine kinase [Phycisphaerae bacterium]|nr:histidine kinase [Gemmatimonadaceae bacterium]
MGRLSTRVRILLVVMWVLPAAASTVGVYFVSPVFKQNMGMAEAFLANLLAWMTWALWVPVILWMSDLLPLERNRWAFSVGVHTVAALVVGGIQVLLFQLVLQQFSLVNPEWKAESLFAVGTRYYAGQMLVVYFAIVGAHAAIRLHAAYRTQVDMATKLEADLVNAQLHALRSQLNPHFLFNALNSVVTLIGRDTQGAQRMIVRLSELLRATLAAGDGSEVQLRQELELVERYLAIERIRFGSRLSVMIDVPADLMAATVPALLLQPLVENAITHGISQISTPGTVSVRAWIDGPILHLEVRDNGPGPLVKAKRPGSGIGVSNLRARLERLYGDEQSVELVSASGGGCIAAVTLPVVYARTATLLASALESSDRAADSGVVAASGASDR